MNVVNDNGRLLPASSHVFGAEAPAALYGDGLFETIRLVAGGMPLWHRHWARLWAGMDALLLERPAEWTADFFAREIIRTAEVAELADACRVRLHVHTAVDGGCQYSIVCAPLPAGGRGVTLGISTKAAKEPGRLSGFKTCNALPYRVAAREAVRMGWDDAVLQNAMAAVVETTRSNIFLSRRGIVFVNPLADGPVSGVMRAQLLEWMQEWGYPTQESSFTLDALYEADEIFLTNALRGVTPVQRLFSHRHFGERRLSTRGGEELARMVEQKFIASGR